MEGDLQTQTSLRICLNKTPHAVHTLQVKPAQLAWCGVVWCGAVWRGVVWCGVVWRGVVWRGVVQDMKS